MPRTLLRPWLHQLRGGSLRFVRRLRSYYRGVRLLMSVHHRLRLLTFRCGPLTRTTAARQEVSQIPTRSFARDVLFDPGGTTMSRITILHMLRSAISDSL